MSDTDPLSVPLTSPVCEGGQGDDQEKLTLNAESESEDDGGGPDGAQPGGITRGSLLSGLRKTVMHVTLVSTDPELVEKLHKGLGGMKPLAPGHSIKVAGPEILHTANPQIGIRRTPSETPFSHLMLKYGNAVLGAPSSSPLQKSAQVYWPLNSLTGHLFSNGPEHNV